MRLESAGPILQTIALPPPGPPASRRLPDAACAAAAGLLTFGLYVATLQPDFGGPEDTPKFQFLGFVLGTAHPPGYPLYSWLSYVFVTAMRVGTIAYRANLLSAVLASLASVVAFGLARQLEARRWPSLCSALALGAGSSFWRSAVFAEVYSLAAVLVAGTIWLLLAWDGRSRSGYLVAATAVFALGLGNHLTIVGLIPACVAYALLRGRRALTPRVVATALGLLALGVAQYGLIIVRTWQDAPYLESRATSLHELFGVITAERYAGQRFAFSPWVLLTDHLPAVASVIGHELGLAGGVLLAIGLLEARRQRSSRVALLAGAAAGLLFMVLNLSGDLNGFITSVMVLLWPLAALGATAVGRALRAFGLTTPAVAGVGFAIAALMPAINLASNYRGADQSAHTGAAVFLRAVFRQLPDGAGMVAENYYFDMAIHYMTLTGEGGPRRGIGRIGFDTATVRAARGVAHHAAGPRRIFAFAGGALFLGTDGLHFERTEIVGPSLDQWLAALPRGTLIVGSAASVPIPLDLSGADHSHARTRERPRTYEAFALRTGTPDAAWRGGDEPVALAAEPGALGSRAALGGALVASADAAGARVTLSGVHVASVDAGLALAAFAADGAFVRSETFARGEPVRMPFLEAVYELTSETPCTDLTSERWTDVSSALATGSWIAALSSIGSVAVETSTAPASATVHAQSTQLMGDGSTGTSISAGADGAQVLTTEMTRGSESRAVFRLSLDAPGARAQARVRPGGVRSTIRVCSHQPARPLFKSGSDSGALKTDFESEAYYGPGWGSPERNQAGGFRHGDARATLLLPLPPGFTYQVALDLASEGGAPVAVLLNGTPVGTCAPDTSIPCEFRLPTGALRDGVSVVTLERATPSSSARRQLVFRGARLRREAARDGAAQR